jgi:hypothetical protein
LGDLFKNKTLGGAKWGFQGTKGITIKMYGDFSALCSSIEAFAKRCCVKTMLHCQVQFFLWKL